MSWISTSQTSVWIRTPWNDCKTQHKCTIPLPLLMGLDHVKHPTPSPIHLARPTCIHEGCWNASWGIERRHRCIHSCHCWLRASASHHWAHGGAHFRHRVGMVARGGWCCLEPLVTSGPLEAAFTGGNLWQVGLFRDLHDLFSGLKIEHAVFDRFCGRNLTMTLRRRRWDHKHTSKIDQSFKKIIVHVFLYLDVRFPPIVGGYSHVCSWQPHLP